MWADNRWADSSVVRSSRCKTDIDIKHSFLNLIIIIVDQLPGLVSETRVVEKSFDLTRREYLVFSADARSYREIHAAISIAGKDRRQRLPYCEAIRSLWNARK